MDYSIFGCRLNKYYLNQWLEYFRSHDFVDIESVSEGRNPYLIATCEVTDRAKHKRVKLAKQKIAEWYYVYITGCWSLKRGTVISQKQFYEIYPDLLPFFDSITLLWESPLQSLSTKWSDLKKDYFSDSSQLLQSWKDLYTKKFIVVQNGCDNYCSFCLTVHKRGVHKTRPLEDIIAEINEFVQYWGKEIVLTGVNIAAWWCSNSTKPEESKFTFLLKNIIEKTQISRIRISSLWPEYLDDEFFQVIANPRILPHFHLSIQSFSDGVLHRMKRNYTAKILDKVLTRMRSLKTKIPVSLGADIIVGFPWETEIEFNETVVGIQKYQINKIHSFPFSNHHTGETIPASLFPDQIDLITKKAREQKIKHIADTFSESFYQLNIWIVHAVLVEGKWSGWTENYLKVYVDPKHKRGEVILCSI